MRVETMLRTTCILILIVTAILGGSSLGSVAVANAAATRVDVADVLVAAVWDASTCDVRVQRRRTGAVNLVCDDGGYAAIMLKVPLFSGANDDGAIRSIRLNDSGSTDNCVAEPPTDARVHHGSLRLIYSNDYDEIGSFDCWYRSLRVRYHIARSGATRRSERPADAVRLVSRDHIIGSVRYRRVGGRRPLVERTS